VYQTRYRLLVELLRRFLVAAVESGDPARVCSVACQAVATMYTLLLGHPVDRRGRCRSCRRPGAVVGLGRRRCRVFIGAGFYLLSSGEFLCSHLARELGLPGPPTREADDLPEPRDSAGVAPTGAPETGVLPAITLDAREPGGLEESGRPELDHGGAGKFSDDPRSRHGPAEDPPPGPGRSLLLTGGNPGVAR
jgi:hypothetical protein